MNAAGGAGALREHGEAGRAQRDQHGRYPRMEVAGELVRQDTFRARAFSEIPVLLEPSVTAPLLTGFRVVLEPS